MPRLIITYKFVDFIVWQLHSLSTSTLTSSQRRSQPRPRSKFTATSRTTLFNRLNLLQNLSKFIAMNRKISLAWSSMKITFRSQLLLLLHRFRSSTTRRWLPNRRRVSKFIATKMRRFCPNPNSWSRCQFLHSARDRVSSQAWMSNRVNILFNVAS